MSETVLPVNPLLSIDTGFRSYLNAYTRSFQNHVIDGQLDYAFDSDFAIRQKLIGLSGWGKLSKAINTTDIAAEAKLLFFKCEQAGSLKYPEIYDILKRCCERLELNQPIVLVRKDLEKPLIYSIASDVLEPCIIITKPLLDMCNTDELELLIGSECGRIQNNHCVYSWAFTYLNYNKNTFKPSERSYKGAVNSQVVATLIDWVRYADVTADRAGMICMSRPGRFVEIFCGIMQKEYVDFFGRSNPNLDRVKLERLLDRNHTIAARGLQHDPSLTELERRVLASAEFLSCDSLFRWRRDIEAPDVHTSTGQVCDVRSNIILSGGQGI
ncbi:hypothetical protein SAMN02910447_00729 [Ruminococcus sp. YE71]|uniref:M48 family metalloprotease n=1 Tax=unclassified Ruminococcus TaxID=2608920 RepID=UPI00088A6806|nr:MULTISPECIES: M48 family metalloprotease [unclassified Ruminococcus]SDA13847.1 hypothetical protein SAMN02910446_00728 [Ruminococcus sp. YE78]SFW19958.1 hypothetical protein SAMN02910447_00729 [Ruminococcus sp. YE71]